MIYLKYTTIPLYYPGRIAGRMAAPPPPTQKAPFFQVFFLPDFGCFSYSILKVEKVGKSQKSRKSRKLPKSAKSQESLDFLRVGKVGKLFESRRVGQVSLLNILCIVFRVGIGVRCNHMFLLIGITKVVFTEEDT